jgi:glutathione S-transferase
MEQQLNAVDWLAADRCTIADIALYAYTHTAGEGGFDLSPYPGARRWLGRVCAQPGHIPQMREEPGVAITGWPG